MIESAANAKFKRIQKLMKQARARKKEGVFVVEGWKMVREALQRDLVQELYCDEKEEQALAKELAKLQKRPAIEVLKTALFKQMSDTVNPQGVLAVITMPSYDREQMISSDECKLLCLENIQDPGNLGTMFRTAEEPDEVDSILAQSVKTTEEGSDPKTWYITCFSEDGIWCKKFTEGQEGEDLWRMEFTDPSQYQKVLNYLQSFAEGEEVPHAEEEDFWRRFLEEDAR